MNKKETVLPAKIVFNWKNLAVIGGFFVLLLTTSLILMFQNGSSDNTNQQAQTSQKDLLVEDVLVGKGKEAVKGSKVTVNYVGTLENGTKFDSSYDRSEPFQFVLGGGEVIEGWDKGILGMKEGGKRKLTIPSSMGYGEDGAPPVIPPNATLIFEVELLKVE
jgi:peptidylprolyl isomerase